MITLNYSVILSHRRSNTVSSENYSLYLCSLRNITWFNITWFNITWFNIIWFNFVGYIVQNRYKCDLLRSSCYKKRNKYLLTWKIIRKKNLSSANLIRWALNLFILRKNLSSVPWDKCARWFLVLPNCQGLPNFRDAVVLPRSRTNCCQTWNLTSVNLHAMIWRKMSIKKTWYLFLVGVPAEIISQMRGNQKVNMEDSYFGMLHNDPYSEYNYYGSQR